MSFIGKAIGSLTGANQQAKAAQNAANTQAAASREATQIQKDMYDQTRKDFEPFRQAGTNALNQLVGFSPSAYQGSQFNFEESPSYQFRKEQGMNGIQSQAAGGGGLLSGATLKALNNYNSDLASQEYNNAFNNWQSQDNNAYSRYMTDQNNQYNRLNNLVGIGQDSAAQQGQAGLTTGQAIANNTMAAGNSISAGQIAAGNRTANNFQSLLGAAGTIGGLFI